jgi:hypothetical protein
LLSLRVRLGPGEDGHAALEPRRGAGVEALVELDLVPGRAPQRARRRALILVERTQAQLGSLRGVVAQRCGPSR